MLLAFSGQWQPRAVAAPLMTALLCASLTGCIATPDYEISPTYAAIDLSANRAYFYVSKHVAGRRNHVISVDLGEDDAPPRIVEWIGVESWDDWDFPPGAMAAPYQRRGVPAAVQAMLDPRDTAPLALFDSRARQFYLYRAGESRPSVAKFDLSDDVPVFLGEAIADIGQEGSAIRGGAGVVDPVRGYALLGTMRGRNSPPDIVKVLLTGPGEPPRVAGTIELDASESNIVTGALDAGAGYVYFGVQGNGAPALVKLAVGTGSALPRRVGAARLAPRTLSNDAITLLDPMRGYAYIGTDSRPARIIKLALGAGDDAPRVVAELAVFDPKDRYFYVPFFVWMPAAVVLALTAVGLGVARLALPGKSQRFWIRAALGIFVLAVAITAFLGMLVLQNIGSWMN